jgi:hypothetical protein
LAANIRLLEHLEKKRAEQLVELVSKGTDIKVARGIVAREESKRLERIAAQRATPVDVEAASAEGHPSGEEDGQPRGDKRMRLSPPDRTKRAERAVGRMWAARVLKNIV